MGVIKTIYQITMKFAAIFLACLVAAQAATFSCPSYDYWCSHNFLVYPANSYYCYTVPFQSCWCTGQYYSNCLVELPKGSGSTCEDEKQDVTACMKVYEDKLSKARTAIKDQLMKNKEEFLKQIDAMHALYTSTYERYLKSCAGLSAADLAARVQNQLKAIASRRHCFVVSIFHKLYAGTGHANT